MENCIFCKIAKGDIPAVKIDENEKYIAFMDIFPPTFDGRIIMPVVLVATKKHLKSNIFEDLDYEEYNSLLKYTRKIAKAIQKGLNPERVCMILEGMEIDHIHPKLYPIFLDSYPGYLSTIKSPGNKDVMAPEEKLKEFAKKIKEQLNNESN